MEVLVKDMKKSSLPLLLCLLLGLSLSFVACEKPEPDPTPVPDPEPEQPVIDDPVEEVSIIGRWKMVYAFQVYSNNQTDMTNFYGTNFQLIFEENGNLITTDGLNEAQMQWTLDGDQLGFIQAEGMTPVMYTVRNLTQDSLSIENGTGTPIVTTMNFVRLSSEKNRP